MKNLETWKADLEQCVLMKSMLKRVPPDGGLINAWISFNAPSILHVLFMDYQQNHFHGEVKLDKQGNIKIEAAGASKPMKQWITEVVEDWLGMEVPT